MPSTDLSHGVDHEAVEIAAAWHAYACGICDCYHINLLNDQGERFAAMVVRPDDLVPLAERLLMLAAQLGQRGVIESGRQN